MKGGERENTMNTCASISNSNSITSYLWIIIMLLMHVEDMFCILCSETGSCGIVLIHLVMLH